MALRDIKLPAKIIEIQTTRSRMETLSFYLANVCSFHVPLGLSMQTNLVYQVLIIVDIKLADFLLESTFK